MKRISLWLLIATSVLASCTDEDLEQDRNVLIRVENVSEYDFDRVTVNTSGGEESYGSVAREGGVSAYRSFEFAYPFATVEVNILGSKFDFTPIDYTGETQLSNGSYTYLVDVDDFTGRRLTLTLRRD